MVAALSIVCLGLLAGSAEASEYYAQVTIAPNDGYFTAPSHSYYQIEICPIANFDVATVDVSGYAEWWGLGNNSNSLAPCESSYSNNTPNSSFTVYNVDPSNSRTFNVYGFY